MRKQTNFFLTLLLIGLILIIGYFYFTRPTKAPSENIYTDIQVLGVENFYTIIPDSSQVEYNMREELNNEPTLVIGSTNQISGNFILDLENPNNSKINDISINARTFKTDQDRRDNAVVRFIIKSEDDDKEFITFKTTEIKNLPEKFEVGQSYPLEILGNLTISKITNSVSFQTIVYIENENEVKITGESTILYKDFNLVIPEFPFLANIDDEVILGLNLFAKKQ
jgi:polyisoprenoid-binding protein YceI